MSITTSRARRIARRIARLVAPALLAPVVAAAALTVGAAPAHAFAQTYQVTGADSQGLADLTLPYTGGTNGSVLLRWYPNGTNLTVACQVNDGSQEDGRMQYNKPFTTWDKLSDGSFVYDWYMNTPTVGTDGYSPGIPPCGSGAYHAGNDYPWSPLCTYGDCGSGTVACSTGNGYCGDPWGMAYGQCVSFVAWKTYEMYGGAQRPGTAQGTQNQNWRPSDPAVNGDPINANWGDAANWASAAAGAGLTVTQTPAVGDIAQWGYDKGMGSAGHVMMVVAVSQGGYITVEGYNTHLDGKYAEWNIPWDDQSWSTGNSYGYAPPWPDTFLVVHP